MGQEDADGGAVGVRLAVAFDGDAAVVAFDELLGDE
jgi:hypothetical protein